MRLAWAGLLFACLMAGPAAATETVTYSYDALGRLTQSSTSGSVNNGLTNTMGYDAAGNRTGYLVSGSPNGSAGTTYDVDAGVYFASMTNQPDATRKGLIDTLITGLKSDGLWAKMSGLVLLAAHDAQAARLNAKAPYKSVAIVNSPTFTTDRGYAGNGSTSYIDIGELPSAGGLYTQNSAFFSVYSNVAATVSAVITTQFIFGTGVTPGSQMYTFSGNVWSRLNNSTDFGGSVAGTTGLFTISRTGATTVKSYRNASVVQSDTTASTGVPAVNVTVGRNGTVYANQRNAVIAWGSGLSDTDVSNLNSRISTYLTAIGAN